MLAYNLLVFDELISGNGSNYYTSTALSNRLGTADLISVFARTTHVSGSPASILVDTEHSPNGQDWCSVAAPQINTSISNDGAYYGRVPVFNPVLLAHVRFHILLSGTTPACRLKLYATGRHRGG